MFGHAKTMAAANIDTEMGLPNRLGVLTSISWGVS